ncbi:MAG: hypothetical protein AAFY33_13095 [Cyanobacteria bacterium J06643_4]
MADTTTLASSSTKTYTGAISPYQSLYLSNQGTITTVAVVSQQSGHPQNSIQFETGEWTDPPLMYPLSTNLVIVIVMTGSTHSFFQIQGTQIQMQRQLKNADAIAQLKIASPRTLQPTDRIPSPPPPPPRPTAKPENSTRKPLAVKRFCTQCGNAIHPSDRFCAYCGQNLMSAKGAS